MIYISTDLVYARLSDDGYVIQYCFGIKITQHNEQGHRRYLFLRINSTDMTSLYLVSRFVQELSRDDIQPIFKQLF